MNRATLEAAIAAKFEAVLQTTLKSTVGNVRYYVANVLDVVGDTGRTINLPYFVIDEGEPTEKAVWGNSEPKPAPADPTFDHEAQAWLRSKIDVAAGNNIIRMFDQFSADNVQERARARLTLENTEAGTLSTVEVAIWKAQGQFKYKVIAA